MNRLIVLFLIIPLVLASLVLGYFYFTGTLTYISAPKNSDVAPTIQVTETQDFQSKEMKIETFVTGLEVPWSMEFTDDNRMLVTERIGRVKVIENGQLHDKPLHEFAEVRAGGEAGLMGMTKDPSYKENKKLYFCMAYDKQGETKIKIAKATDAGDSLTNIETIIDGFPAARVHAGCRIKFGPDKKLYVTLGDTAEKGLAQDKNSPAGKILRYNADGSIPSDGVFANSAIFSLGHRNPQGIDWHPETGQLYQTEHGPSGFDGPGGGDEVNHIIKGENYGWPEVSHTETKEGFVDPLYVMTPAEAPASGMFYSGVMFPEWENNFFFGALKGEGLMKVTFENADKVASVEKLFHEEYGRIRDVTQGPDGSLYFSTSNRDGRGSPKDEDDRIIRLFKN